jgi:hypothetical protein
VYASLQLVVLNVNLVRRVNRRLFENNQTSARKKHRSSLLLPPLLVVLLVALSSVMSSPYDEYRATSASGVVVMA